MSTGDITLWRDADAIRIINGDPEPRMRSGSLAEMLQHSSHQGLARLIERHRENLNELSRLVTMTNRPSGGGIEWTEYWLTEPQCIYLAAKSETDVANRITVEVIKQFDLYRKGLLVPNGSQIQQLIRTEFTHLTDALHRIEDLLRSGITELRYVARETHDGVLFCVEELRGSRKELSEHTLRVHRFVIETRFMGECPVCRQRRIVDGGSLVNAAAHHHVARNNANFDATIIVCVECHRRYHDPASVEFRALFHQAFGYYHTVARGSEQPKTPQCRVEQLRLRTPPEEVQ